jgi:hypothetical protein
LLCDRLAGTAGRFEAVFLAVWAKRWRCPKEGAEVGADFLFNIKKVGFWMRLKRAFVTQGWAKKNPADL